MTELEVRHRKEDLSPFSVLVERISAIEGLPDGAARPLSALIRSSGVETSSHLSEIRSSLRHDLGELLAILNQRNETSGDEAIRARAFLDTISTSSGPTVRRSDIVVPAIAVLIACGCRMKEAAALIARVYPVTGWTRVEPKTVADTFYGESPAELRGNRNKHHDRIRAKFERLADEIELDD